jgi:hypothetical protein
VERSFETAQDRLVKGLGVARIKTLEQANDYLEKRYIPQWESKFTVLPACGDDAHRRLLPEHNPEAILSRVEQRVVTNNYTFQFHGRTYQIARGSIVAGLRGARIQVEQRWNGEVHARFNSKYLTVSRCVEAIEPAAALQRADVNRAKRDPAVAAAQRKKWMQSFWDKPAPTIAQAMKIANATS